MRTIGAMLRATAMRPLLAAALWTVGCAASGTQAAQRTAAPGEFEVVHDRAQLEAALARASGSPVLLDVTAAWCMPCVQLSKETFTDPRVIARLGTHHWIALDVSDGSDEHLALQAFFGAGTLPRVLLWADGAPVLAALRAAAPAAPKGTLELSSFVTADELIGALARVP